jgi:hypothetical protein
LHDEQVIPSAIGNSGQLQKKRPTPYHFIMIQVSAGKRLAVESEKKGLQNATHRVPDF